MSEYRLFGFPVSSELALPGAWSAAPPSAEGDATVLVIGELPPWAGAAEGGWQGMSDGKAFTVERSNAGEYRFSHGGRALFALSADHRSLTCAPGQPLDLGWWRILMDSVLFTVSLLRGNEALHAGAVATSSGAVAILAGSGAGKSTLLGQLLREGHELVTDDVLFLRQTADHLLADPGPPLMTLPVQRSAGVGTPLGDVGNEIWVATPVVGAALPLRRVVLLDRRPGASTGLYPVAHPLGVLMPHMLKFPGTRARELVRFSLASAVATEAEMWHLVADATASPQELARLVMQGLLC